MSKKKELEIVYNLEWKNKPANGDEKSNMVGILDIPATTLDWKTFKSYLVSQTDLNVTIFVNFRVNVAEKFGGS